VAGQQLRSLREQRRLSVRDVEEASGRIAEAKGDERYRISNGWLVHLEKSLSPPNMYHLFALAATYRVHLFDLLHLYGINVEEQAQYEAIANPKLTRLLSPGHVGFDLVAPPLTRLAPELAARLPVSLASSRNKHPNISYAQLGSNEVTMHPLVRPGSIITIDTNQKKVEVGYWPNDCDRPIYFIELRDHFTCAWAERRENKLLVVGYRWSSVQEFMCPQDAEIVGRVVAYHTPCVDPEVAQAAKQRATTG
jgi:transcriptional regulator with XRE-family HTH domain